ncbi:MAG: nucleotidyltransferase domain-containing protein [Spirochaetes bacterium]|nr:nucleotidyltransferase domain-containing protein [Spirochaetota bacterium]
MVNLTRDQLINFIKANKQYLKSEYHIVEIGLFGSFARNEQNTGSDIDLVIEFDNSIKNIYEQKRKVRDFFKKNCNRETDITRKKYLKPRIKQQILKDVIYV